MIIEEALKILSVLALSSTKYLMGIGLAIAYGFDFPIAMVTTVAGGIAGVIFFIYLGTWARKVLAYFFPKLRNIRPAWSRKLTRSKSVEVQAAESPNEKGGRRAQLMQSIINNYGLAGIALLTPVLFTVPIGTLIAVALNFPRARIVIYMAGAFVIWSLLLTGIITLLGVDVPALFSKI